MATATGAIPKGKVGADVTTAEAEAFLDRWDVPSRFVVFTSVADALQAREFAASGYGTGWALDG